MIATAYCGRKSSRAAFGRSRSVTDEGPFSGAGLMLQLYQLTPAIFSLCAGTLTQDWTQASSSPWPPPPCVTRKLLCTCRPQTHVHAERASLSLSCQAPSCATSEAFSCTISFLDDAVCYQISLQRLLWI